jgi:Stress responsive A/B Barrel Domain
VYVHIAIFKWKPDVDDTVVHTALQKVKSLEELVDGISEIHVGANYSKWNKGFTHAVVVIGQSQDAIDRYREHPVHVAVAHDIDSMEEDGIGIDFHE